MNDVNSTSSVLERWIIGVLDALLARRDRGLGLGGEPAGHADRVHRGRLCPGPAAGAVRRGVAAWLPLVLQPARLALLRLAGGRDHLGASCCSTPRRAGAASGPGPPCNGKRRRAANRWSCRPCFRRRCRMRRTSRWRREWPSCSVTPHGDLVQLRRRPIRILESSRLIRSRHATRPTANWALQQPTDLAAWQKFFRRHPLTDAAPASDTFEPAGLSRRSRASDARRGCVAGPESLRFGAGGVARRQPAAQGALPHRL